MDSGELVKGDAAHGAVFDLRGRDAPAPMFCVTVMAVSGAGPSRPHREGLALWASDERRRGRDAPAPVRSHSVSGDMV